MKTMLTAIALMACGTALAMARPPTTRPGSDKLGTRKPPATAPATAPAAGPFDPAPPASGSESAPPAAARSGNGDANGRMIVTPYPTRATSTLVNVTEGSLPIIISAPHGGTSVVPNVPPRQGVGVEQFETVTDTNTRQLAEKLCAAIERELGGKPYSVIARFDREYIDANRDARNAFEDPDAAVHYYAYHQPLQRFCDQITQRYGRGLLIDLHGQGADANAIFRGTRTGASVKHLIDDFGNNALIGPNSVIGQMQQRGYTFYPTPTATGIGTETQYNGGYITYAYGAINQAHMDSIQLETGGGQRNTAALQQKTADDLAASIAVFARTYYGTGKEVPTEGN